MSEKSETPTLIERLREFPQFISHDRVRWYMSAKEGNKEPLCIEAADEIERLERALSAAQKERDNLQSRLDEISLRHLRVVKSMQSLQSSLTEAERRIGELRVIGGRMANMVELACKSKDTPPELAKLMTDLYKQWDAAMGRHTSARRQG